MTTKITAAPKIHALAVVHPRAELDSSVEVGPYSVIDAGVKIGAQTIIGSHVVIKGLTEIGANNRFFQFSSIGEDPQDKKYQGEKSYLKIGDHNIFREYCTANRGTEQGGGSTEIGSHNLFMAYTHIAHDCKIGSHVIFSNNASIAGHVSISDFASLGGLSGVHQFCKIGTHGFVAGGAIVFKDVLPFVTVAGCPAEAHGLNIVGLQRRGFTSDQILLLKRAYKIIFRQNLTTTEAIRVLESDLMQSEELGLLIDSLKQSERGIVR